MRVTKEDAIKRGLTERLSLRGSYYIAYISHPGGGTTIMEAHGIISENAEEYELEEPTQDELDRLERKYARDSEKRFMFSSRQNQKI